MQRVSIEAPARLRLDLEPVMPLLEYLYSLPGQEGCDDRTLTWAEDEWARHVLEKLELRPECPLFARYLTQCLESDSRRFRTLAVWYLIARNLARYLQYCE